MSEKKITAIILVLTIVSIQILNLMSSAVLAIYEELENQNSYIENTMVSFDVYNMESKKHQQKLKISEGGMLEVAINIDETGVLNDAKIYINNANFVLDDEKIDFTNIQEIDTQNNYIILKQLVTGRKTIKLPIKFNKTNKIDASIFENKNEFVFTANYKSNSNKEKKIEKTIETVTEWTDDLELSYNNEFLKFINISENNMLLEQKIEVMSSSDLLPKKSEEITVNVPVINGTKPVEVEVMRNGKKIERMYDKENGTLDIQYKNMPDENNKISLSNKIDVYKIIYRFDKKIDLEEISQPSHGKIDTMFYAIDEKITKEFSDNLKVKENNEIIDSEQQSIGEISKQYLSTNSEKKSYVQEDIKLEVSDILAVKDISLVMGKSYFISNNIKDEAKIYMENTYINKEEINAIFGLNAEISVFDENENEIYRIDTTTETDNDGNYVIQYPDKTRMATLKIKNTPIQIGEFTVKNTKYFVGETGIVSKNLEKYSKLQNETILKYSGLTQNIISEIELIEEEVKAEIIIDTNKLTTEDINKSVKLSIELDSKNTAGALYNNPKIAIIMPKQIKNININSSSILYNENLKIEKVEKNTNENGNIVVLMELKGKIEDYIDDNYNNAMVLIDADIELYKNLTSSIDKINVTIQNQNSTEKDFVADIEIEAKNGIFTFSKLEGIEKDKIFEDYGGKENNILLETGRESKNAIREISIVNNMENIQNVVITGIISDDSNEKNIQIKYLNEVHATKQQKIQYSMEIEGENWIETVADFTQVKRFRIEIGDCALSEIINIKYDIMIPEKLKENMSGSINEILEYSINGQKFTESTKINLYTQKVNNEENQEVVENNTEKLKIKYSAISGNSPINNVNEVYNGQSIMYKIEITNISDKAIEDLQLSATQENAIFFNNVKVTGINPDNLEANDQYWYKEDEQCKEYKFDKIALNAKETRIFTYQFTVNKNTDKNYTIGKIKVNSKDFEQYECDTFKNTIKDSDIKITILPYYSNEQKTIAGSVYQAVLKVKNFTDTELTNVQIKEYLSKGIKYVSTYIMNEEGYEEEEIDADTSENGILKINIPKLKANEEYEYMQYFELGEVNESDLLSDEFMYVTSTCSEKTTYSNILNISVIQDKANCLVEFVGNKSEEYLVNGEDIEYTCTITNNGIVGAVMEAVINISRGIDIIDVYYTKASQKEKIENVEENTITKSIYLEPDEQIIITVKGKVNEKNLESDLIVSIAEVNIDDRKIVSNKMEYKLKNDDEKIENEDKPTEETPEIEEKNNTISGQAWLDKNENGIKESNEEKIPELVVKLINLQGQQVQETKTNEKGEYKFINVKNDKYFVAIVYNKDNYTPTIYQKDGVDEKINSDTIARFSNNENLAATNILNIQNNDLYNIDAGFIKNKKFDFSLDKSVTKVTIQNDSENIVKTFKDSKLAKVDINAKKLEKTTVLIEYKIKVTNEGELAGTVNQIVDYIPQDVIFDETLNSSWHKGNDGNLYTTSLTNIEIKPGESQEVSLILKKKMTENNVGTTFNTAEISKISNKQGVEDIDSIPNNKDTKEDDFSQADVIISIKTGGFFISSTLIILMIFIVSIIIYLRRERYEN